MESLNNAIHNARKKLDIVFSNMKMSVVQRNTHSSGMYLIIIKYLVSEEIYSKIKIYTGLKVVFLICFSVVQIYFITSKLNNNVVTNIYVNNSNDESNRMIL
jgi:uncharacterized membrane protein YagU involved in acid resistance